MSARSSINTARGPLVVVLALAQVVAARADATDLSWPPPGQQAPRIHAERGEHNVGRQQDPADGPRRHVIIGPDFRVRPASPAPASAGGSGAPEAALRQTPQPRSPARAPAPQAHHSAGNALLWRISTATGAVSHLYGTIHLEDPRVLELPPVVDDAFRDADTVVLEARLDDINPLALAGEMMLADGRTLEQIAGARLFQDAAVLLARQGVPALVAQRLKPWAAAVILSVPRPETGMFLDRMLAQRARNAGKAVRGLERLDEQLDALAGMSEADQLALLRDAVARFSQLPAAVQEMVEAYLARDVEALARLGRKLGPADSGLAGTFEERLIRNRNVRMAERVRPLLDAGGAFVAIGALHLAGPDGVPGLLAQAGYRVEPVY